MHRVFTAESSGELPSWRCDNDLLVLFDTTITVDVGPDLYIWQGNIVLGNVHPRGLGFFFERRGSVDA